MNDTPRRRVLSGMRPTGRLHLGNYMGALYNWVKLQEDYDCYFFIADWHALTTDYEDPSRLLDNIFEITLDFLSAGLDPQKCTIFIQSHVPQHAELNLLFGMFTPLGLLERVPTYKDQQEQLREKDLATYGFLGYPLLQSADILLYQPDYVPVGQDQVAHVELTREIARKFNHLYSPKKLVIGENGVGSEELDTDRVILPVPEVLLTPSPKLPGLDGRKMSKSYGNSILLSDWPSNVVEKMSRMSNGGQRNPQSTPGDPDVCPVGDMHKLFSEPAIDEFIRKSCRDATLPCAQCKVMAADGINSHLVPIRDRREQLERSPGKVWDILEAGAARAQLRAEQTMQQVRDVTGLSRTRRPVPSGQRLRFQGPNYPAPHDMQLQQSWWNVARAFRERNLRDYWRSSLVPSETPLKAEDDRMFVTRAGKRVLVCAAREDPAQRWVFQAKVKTCEVLVLLCWDAEFRMHDFVIPQSVFVAPWTAQKKLYKKDEMIFYVTAQDGRFTLILPGASLDITDYRGRYQPIM
jgi:tryptophanyl-tRNA synthetase